MIEMTNLSLWVIRHRHVHQPRSTCPALAALVALQTDEETSKKELTRQQNQLQVIMKAGLNPSQLISKIQERVQTTISDGIHLFFFFCHLGSQ